jgi:hypothetical protein
MQPQKGSIPMQKPSQPAPVRNVPQPGVSPVAAPAPFAASTPKTLNTSMPGGSHIRRTYAPGIARFLSQVRLAEQLGGEQLYGYAINNPINYVDPSGNRPQKSGQRPTIGQDKHKPPDCSKAGTGCKPVWFTCNANTIGKKLAVYCAPDAGCLDKIYVIGTGKKQHRVKKGTPGARLIECSLPCGEVCKEYGRTLSPPVFQKNSTVCIHGEHGNRSRKIDDCGCGQPDALKPKPDNWMDFEGEDCSDFKDGWRCVCPGPCP